MTASTRARAARENLASKTATAPQAKCGGRTFATLRSRQSEVQAMHYVIHGRSGKPPRPSCCRPGSAAWAPTGNLNSPLSANSTVSWSTTTAGQA